MKKHNCIGCHDDFYNGKNDYGVKECWSFKTAKMVWRIPIGINERPPYLNKRAIRIPDCYKESGSGKRVFIKKEALDSRGFWR